MCRLTQYLLHILVLLFAWTACSWALPIGPEIIAGHANISLNGANTKLTITNADNSIINWQEFSIQVGESTVFLQPSETSAILNRVVGQNMSEIFGSLESNGNVLLINQNGILIGESGSIHTAGFMASTLDISNDDFLNGGDLHFSGDSTAGITNLGTIDAVSGDIYLISLNILNEGTISAPEGTAGLIAGQDVLLSKGNGNRPLVKILEAEVEEGKRTAIENTGIIEAARIEMEAAGGNIYSLAVNNKGVVEATGTRTVDGVVYLTSPDSKISNSGTIRSKSYDGNGGKIYMGETALLNDISPITITRGSFINTGTIDASGDHLNAMGGSIAIAAGYVGLGGLITADGKIDGGMISVRGNHISLAENISAKGELGKGGQISIEAGSGIREISSSVIDASGADGGSIYVDGGNALISSGNYLAKGTLGDGGLISVTARDMRLLSSNYDASGAINGGYIRAGGDVPGSGALLLPEHLPELEPISQALRFASTSGTTMNASGGLNTDGIGNGGAISVWGTQSATVFGQYSTEGGSVEGQGGLIDFSSEGSVSWNSSATKIFSGKGGNFRLDPKDIIISDQDLGTTQYNIVLGSGYGYLSTGTDLDGSDSFGRSVSLNANRLAVGAINDGGFGETNTSTGAVYLFNFSDDSFSDGTLQGIIGHGYTGGNNVDISASLASSDNFGSAVALDGTQLAVGATGTDNGTGAVYLFNFSDTDFNGGSHTNTIGSGKSIDPGTIDTFDLFGASLSLNNNRLAIGASGDDGFGVTQSNPFIQNNYGAVYLYKFDDTNFTNPNHTGTIGFGYTDTNDVDLTTNLTTKDQLGISVSWEDSQLVVGASGDDGLDDTAIDSQGNAATDSGAVHLFTTSSSDATGATLVGTIGFGYDGTTNTKDIDLNDLSIVEGGDSFGYSVSLSGNNLAIGATNDDGLNNTALDAQGNAATNSGAVYLFSFDDSSFSFTTATGHKTTIGAGYSVSPGTIDAADNFGESVSLSGTQLAIGTVYDDGSGNSTSESGSVYLYKFSDTTFSTVSVKAQIGLGYIDTKDIDLGSGFEEALASGDNFATAISLDGLNLAASAPGDDGFNNDISNAGAVYLFNFSDSNYSGGSLQAIIGADYVGGRNIDLTDAAIAELAAEDGFGSGVSLSGTTLAVGASGDDGSANVSDGSGAVYLFSFSDSSFNGGTLQKRIGRGYDIDNTDLEDSDAFGASVSLTSTGELAVGATGDDGLANLNTTDNYGAVYLYNFDTTNFTDATPFVGTVGSGYNGANDYDVTDLDTGDEFGSAVSINGTRMAVGAHKDYGSGNSASESGAVYLMTFGDNSLNGTSLSGKIGRNYSGGNNVNLSTLDSGDKFGTSVSLSDTTLAVGAIGDAGSSNSASDSGAAYIFAFDDLSFSNGILDATIGNGYSGVNNYNVSGLEGGDNFGSAVSLSGTVLAVGAKLDDGSGNAVSESGAIYFFTPGTAGDPANAAYSYRSGEITYINPSDITALLNSSQNVTLQASNDITVSSAITASAGGNGGAFTLQAGRSIVLDNNISINSDGGNVTLLANADLSTGVVNSDREAGSAVITMNSGSSIDSGNGNIDITLDDGAGKSETAAGAISLQALNSNGTITVSNQNGDIILNETIIADADANADATSRTLLLDAIGHVDNRVGETVLSTGNGTFLVYSLDDTKFNGLTAVNTQYEHTRSSLPESQIDSSANTFVLNMDTPVTVLADKFFKDNNIDTDDTIPDVLTPPNIEAPLPPVFNTGPGYIPDVQDNMEAPGHMYPGDGGYADGTGAFVAGSFETPELDEALSSDARAEMADFYLDWDEDEGDMDEIILGPGDMLTVEKNGNYELGVVPEVDLDLALSPETFVDLEPVMNLSAVVPVSSAAEQLRY